MRIDIVTLFPQMCKCVLSESIIGRAISKNVVEVHVHNIRDHAEGKYRKVDDYIYGGGFGMLLQPEPVYQCVRALKDAAAGDNIKIIYMSPKGARLTQKKVLELAGENRLIVLAGHYEGVDQRVLDLVVDEEISIGDYVLTGGELPALVLVDAVLRCVSGVLPSEECFLQESHSDGELEHAQYTRPEVWRGFKVPEELLSGDPRKIDEWKRKSSLEITRARRPDLLQ